MEAGMSWKTILVGVDASPAAARAAQVGLQIATAAQSECRLIHATRDTWGVVAEGGLLAQAAAFRAAALHEVRAQIEAALAGLVPWDVLHDLHVREGWPPAALEDEAHETKADLVVLGAKHHSALGRWLGGSTVHNVARMLRTPLLVVGTPPAAIRRVLVAADASSAARPTIEAAQRFADLFDAELRVLHVIEPMPMLPETPPTVNPRDYERLLEEESAQKIWPLVRADADQVTRYASAETGIAAEAQTWGADVVVVGSHGKGFVERMLVGSVTERLLNQLPSPMLLVVPAGRRVQRTTPVEEEAGATMAAAG
jgi:nucleotide-binding universal stress UspA family protein